MITIILFIFKVFTLQAKAFVTIRVSTYIIVYILSMLSINHLCLYFLGRNVIVFMQNFPKHVKMTKYRTLIQEPFPLFIQFYFKAKTDFLSMNQGNTLVVTNLCID